MRKRLAVLALLAALAPMACKSDEKSGSTGTSAKQVTYACKCGATKTAPEGQAPS